MNKVILLLLIPFGLIYAVPKINPISPYINRGVSMQLQMAYNPLTIKYGYKREASGNQYVAYANDLYLTQKKLVRNGYVAVGTKDEKKEFTASHMMLPWRIQVQYKANVFEGGKSNLFQNISISPFVGNSFTGYVYHVIFDEIFTKQRNGYIQLYTGVAIGTRKKIIDGFSYIEIFTSLQLSGTYYGGLGGGQDENPIADIHPDWDNYTTNLGTTEKFGKIMFDFTAPVGVGLKYRNLIVKAGIAITTTFGGEERTYKNGKLTIDSHNLPHVPVFMEIGCHFRMFKKLDREREMNFIQQKDMAMN